MSRSVYNKSVLMEMWDKKTVEPQEIVQAGDFEVNGESVLVQHFLAGGNTSNNRKVVIVDRVENLWGKGKEQQSLQRWFMGKSTSARWR